MVGRWRKRRKMRGGSTMIRGREVEKEQQDEVVEKEEEDEEEFDDPW